MINYSKKRKCQEEGEGSVSHTPHNNNNNKRRNKKKKRKEVINYSKKRKSVTTTITKEEEEEEEKIKKPIACLNNIQHHTNIKEAGIEKKNFLR